MIGIDCGSWTGASAGRRPGGGAEGTRLRAVRRNAAQIHFDSPPCWGRAFRDGQFNTIGDLAAQLPGVSYDVIETTVIGAIHRGLLRGWINEPELFDGSIVTVSGIRG